MKIMIQIIRGLLAVVWVLLLAVNIKLYRDGSYPPRLEDWAFWTVPDSAMEPAYLKDDLVIAKWGETAQPGDAVLYRAGDTLTLSRIIGTSEEQLIMKSDGAEDSILVPPQAVEGVCVTFLPGFGPAAEFMRSLPGLAVIFVAGLVLIVLPGIMLRSNKGGRNGPGSPRADRVTNMSRSTRDPAPRPSRGSQERPGARDTRRRSGYTPRH